MVHVNAGSELILRQLFDRFGQQVHLLTPTYALFPEIARRYTETQLLPERDFAFDLSRLEVPDGTTLAVIVNPDNPTGNTFDMEPLRRLLQRHPETRVRFGYAVLPGPLADELNASNAAYPLARPSEAAAIATLEHEDRIRERGATLRAWTDDLAANLRAMGVRTFPTETYFFLLPRRPRHGAAHPPASTRRGG